MSEVLQQSNEFNSIHNDMRLIEKFDLNNVPKPNTLDELAQILHRVFAHDSINIDYVKQILRNYDSNPKEWNQYAKYDPYKWVKF